MAVREVLRMQEPIFYDDGIIKPFKTKRICIIQVVITYRAVNTVHLTHKTPSIYAVQDKVALCSEIHTKLINTISATRRIFILTYLLTYSMVQSPS